MSDFFFRCIEDKNTFSCVGAGSYLEGMVAFAGEGSGDLTRFPGLRQRIVLSLNKTTDDRQSIP